MDKTGKVVCANCHLATKPIRLSGPQAVMPGSSFDLTITIPTDKRLLQIMPTGLPGTLNVGCIVILPVL